MAASAEAKKTVKYRELARTHHVVETSDAWLRGLQIFHRTGQADALFHCHTEPALPR